MKHTQPSATGASVKADATRLLDPFLGIGSSALAAKSQKISSFTGIEMDRHYIEVAKRRLDPPGEEDLFRCESTENS